MCSNQKISFCEDLESSSIPVAFYRDLVQLDWRSLCGPRAVSSPFSVRRTKPPPIAAPRICDYFCNNCRLTIVSRCIIVRRTGNPHTEIWWWIFLFHGRTEMPTPVLGSTAGLPLLLGQCPFDEPSEHRRRLFELFRLHRLPYFGIVWPLPKRQWSSAEINRSALPR